MTIGSEKVKRFRRKRAELLIQLKDKPCVDCGIKYPSYVMQFDHVRGEKSFIISGVRHNIVSLKRLLAEIDKCDLVCANCHAERTHKTFQGISIGREIGC